MKNKQRYGLRDLYHNSVLFTQSLGLIHRGLSYRKIQDFLHGQGFECSLGVIQHLVQKVRYSKENHVPIDKLLDKRSYNKQKKSLADVAKEGHLHLNGMDKETGKIVKSSLNQAKGDMKDLNLLPQTKYYSVRQVLDLQVQEYYDELKHHDITKGMPRAGEKAAELLLKYKGDDALSLNAIRQYMLIGQAKFRAMMSVAMEMFPPKVLKEFETRADKAINGVTKQIQITPDGKKLIEALHSDGIDIGDDSDE